MIDYCVSFAVEWYQIWSYRHLEEKIGDVNKQEHDSSAPGDYQESILEIMFQARKDFMVPWAGQGSRDST